MSRRLRSEITGLKVDLAKLASINQTVPDIVLLSYEDGDLFITRDARQKERKKPGQPAARKRFQFSKR